MAQKNFCFEKRRIISIHITLVSHFSQLNFDFAKRTLRTVEKREKVFLPPGPWQHPKGSDIAQHTAGLWSDENEMLDGGIVGERCGILLRET